MEITVQTFIIICPLLFLTGFVDSIGGGGGLIALPAYLFAGLPVHNALATNKLSSSLGTTVSVTRMYKHMDLPLAGVCVVCSMIGSILGANAVLLVNEKIIEFMLLPLLPIIAYYVLRNKDLSKSEIKEKHSKKKTYVLAMLVSFLIGSWDGFYGPGTGTFLILLYTGLVRLDLITASANTKAVNLASNVGSLIVYILNGKVLYMIGIPAALCCMAGNYVGSGLVLTNGSRIVRPIILVVIALLFITVLTEL